MEQRNRCWEVLPVTELEETETRSAQFESPRSQMLWLLELLFLRHRSCEVRLSAKGDLKTGFDLYWSLPMWPSARDISTSHYLTYTIEWSSACIKKLPWGFRDQRQEQKPKNKNKNKKTIKLLAQKLTHPRNPRRALLRFPCLGWVSVVLLPWSLFTTTVQQNSFQRNTHALSGSCGTHSRH